MSKKVMSKKGGKRSGDGDLEAALEVRGFGGEDEAESALRALLKGGDKETREIAQYELALLLHSLGERNRISPPPLPRQIPHFFVHVYSPSFPPHDPPFLSNPSQG